MVVTGKKNGSIDMLERTVNSGTRIILYDSTELELLELLCSKFKESELSDVELWHCMEEYKACGNERVTLKIITREQMDEIITIYRLYDFSDRVSVVSDSWQFGSLFNYVKMGIITGNELISAFLEH